MGIFTKKENHWIISGKSAAESRVLRFWAKVNKNGPIPSERPELGPCWVWIGCLRKDGYGAVGWNYKVMLTHKVAFMISGGAISRGLQIDHLCRNRACVNVKHLESVTQLENIRRGKSICTEYGKRTHCKNGHEFTKENIYVWKGAKTPYRICRACNLEKNKRSYVPHPIPIKTQCKRGHPFDERNTYIYRGMRKCKECIRIRGRIYDRNRTRVR